MEGPEILSDGTPRWVKDPGATKDYDLDWEQWLGVDEILSSEWAVSPAGLTIYADNLDGAISTVWLEGGALGRHYRASNTIETVGGRIEVRSIEIVIKKR